MAVASTTSRVQYVGNNSTVTAYPVSFFFLDEAWLNVQVVSSAGVVTTLTLGADYEVTGAGNPAGGTITTTIAYANTFKLTIFRIVPLSQLLDLVYNDRLPAAQLELSLDKLTFIAQQISTLSANPGERALTFPVTEPDTNLTTLPTPAARLGKFLYFSATTGELEPVSGATLIAIIGTQFIGLTGLTGPTGPAFAPTITTESTVSRTLALADVGTYIRCTNAATTTITIPVTGTGGGQVNFEVGAEIYFRRAAAGAIALSVVGVTVNGSSQLTYVAQGQNFAIKHLGASVWDFI